MVFLLTAEDKPENSHTPVLGLILPYENTMAFSYQALSQMLHCIAAFFWS
jgi:hypothetical protein